MLSAQPLHRLMWEHRQQASLQGFHAPMLHNPTHPVAHPARASVGVTGRALLRPLHEHRRHATRVAANPLDGLIYTEGYTEVDEVCGCRLVLDSEPATVEYLIKWKDGSEQTWESPKDLSEDLVRMYDEAWWTAAKKADGEVLAKMLAGGRQLLAQAVDKDRRSALHFAAALGKTDVTKLLLEAGAYADLQDKEGYTPLHMAAGYMHTGSMTALLESGANPEVSDNTGRSTVALIDNLRLGMPLSTATVTRRLALEEVNNCLIDRLYEEVAPMQILDVRTRDGPPPPPSDPLNPAPVPPPAREFLVQFADGGEDAWVAERHVSKAVIEDWEAGLEYALALEVLDVAQVGTERKFKIRWSDGYPTSWEPEESVPPQLVALFQRQSPQLFEERTRPENSTGAGDGTWAQEYQTQWRVGASPSRPSEDGAGSSPGPSSSQGSAAQQQEHQEQQAVQHGDGVAANGAGNGHSGGNGGSPGAGGQVPGKQAVGAL